MKSHTLEAMGIGEDRIDSALRFSFSSTSTLEEALKAAEALKEAAETLERK